MNKDDYQKLFVLTSQLRLAAMDGNLPRANQFNIQFCKIYKKLYPHNVYVEDHPSSMFDRARNNYINSFGIGKREVFLDTGNKLFSKLQKLRGRLHEIPNYMNYQQYIMEQVSSNDKTTLISKLRVNLDTKTLAELWPDFVNFEKRRKTEIPFLLSHLKEYENPKVFDACLGSGATTLGLKLKGIENIVSNDIDKYLIEVAQSEANKIGKNLNITSFDWRELNKHYKEEFDVVLCLGNSLTYLFKREDQLKTLENFRYILKPNGKLIIDERNYAEHFLKENYKYSGNFVYCGKDKVNAHPIFISNSMVVMEYKHNQTGDKAHLVMYPFKEGEMTGLIKESGFKQIISYGDYKKEFMPETPEFITHVCDK